MIKKAGDCKEHNPVLIRGCMDWTAESVAEYEALKNEPCPICTMLGNLQPVMSEESNE